MKLGIIGCGNMGQALLRGVTGHGGIRPRDILCTDIQSGRKKRVKSRFAVGLAGSNSELAARCGAIVIAVKPKDLIAVLDQIGPSVKKALIISICAGVSTAAIEKRLGKVAVVRVMPNMPAQLGQGISALASGKYVRPHQRKAANAIFSCIGEVVYVSEDLMDAVTAISGSGPAYFFYLVESLTKAAVKMGIPRKVARRLAVKTASGSGLLLERSKENAKSLRAAVTSKGGTTEAAFKVFKKEGLEGILWRGFSAAKRRSRQISR